MRCLLVLARDAAAFAEKRDKFVVSEASRVFVGTVEEAIDLFVRNLDAGAQLMITRAHENDMETCQLLASGVMPQFA